MDATLNTWTLIFLVAAVHGFVLSVLFYRREEGRRTSNMLLSILLALFSLTLVDYVAYWTGYQMVYPHLIRMSHSFTFLFGPILYLYVISILKPGKVYQKKHMIHFIPFLGLLIIDSPFYMLSAEAKIQLLETARASGQLSYSAVVIASLKILHLSSYAVMLLLMIKYEGFRDKMSEPGVIRYSKRWLSTVSYCFIGFTLSYASYYVLIHTIDFKIQYDYMISFAMTVFIFTVGYLGYLNPDDLLVQSQKAKYDNSNLTNDEAEACRKELIELMESEKIYKEAALRIHDIADRLDIAPHHLSQVMNETIGQNFFEFINSYRVQEARKLLMNPANKDLTILHVAYESGFNNKTSFNRSFKKNVGITPSQFRKNHTAQH